MEINLTSKPISSLNTVRVLACQQQLLLLLSQLLEVPLPEPPHEGDEGAVAGQLHLSHRDRLLHADPAHTKVGKYLSRM